MISWKLGDVLTQKELDALKEAISVNKKNPMVGLGTGSVKEVAFRVTDVTNEENLEKVKSNPDLKDTTKIVKFLSVEDFEHRDYYVTGVQPKIAYLNKDNEIIAQTSYMDGHGESLHVMNKLNNTKDYTYKLVDSGKKNDVEVYLVERNKRENKQGR